MLWESESITLPCHLSALDPDGSWALHPAMSNPLPIAQHRAEIEAAIDTQTQIILEAPPGAGKSTQVPGYLAESLPVGRIFVLQPRRIAARMLARRVAHERGGSVGGEVGYQVRFDSKMGRSTRILFVTEGILLRRLIGDPQLREAAAVVFDEFHERHLDADIALAQMLNVQAARPDLRLVVMSATLDTRLLQDRLPEARTLSIPGRAYPVEVNYHPPKPREAPVWETAAKALAAVWTQSEGDALVFMPGAYEIRRTIEELTRNKTLRDATVLPLYGELSPQQQDAALEPRPNRKIVVATNVAETSLTIDGIRVVVDSGLARVSRYDPRRRIDTLYLEKISRASAEQRAGRAGRTAPGVCLRLWPAASHEQRPPHEEPEIRRVDLAEPALMLTGLHGPDLDSFGWIEPPDSERLAESVQLLRRLGAANDAGLTDIGQAMLRVPAHPRYARLLVESHRLGIGQLGVAATAILQSRRIWLRKLGKASQEKMDQLFLQGTSSDLVAAVRAFQFAGRERCNDASCRPVGIDARAAAEIARVFAQLDKTIETGGEDPLEEPEVALLRALLAAFPDQIAHRLDRGTFRCALIGGRRANLDKTSAARDSEWVLGLEIAEIEGRGEVRAEIKSASAVPLELLLETFADRIEEREEAFWDVGSKSVMRRVGRWLEDLEIEGRTTDRPDPAAAASILAAKVRAGDLRLDGWDDAVEQWIERVNLVASSMPELEFPAIGDEARQLLLEQICDGLRSYKELRERNVLPVIESWLSYEQRRLLDRFAPTRIDLPRRAKAKVRYRPGLPPVLATRLQDLFGSKEPPKLAGGRIPLVVELLAPNMRPVQTTQDLTSFWREIYPKLRVEMKRRYPKHAWPEDPLTG